MSTFSDALGIEEEEPPHTAESVGELLPVSPDAQQLEHYRILQESDNDLKVASRHAMASGLTILNDLHNYDPRFQARMAEVAASLLDTATKAIRSRQDASQTDQKLKLEESKANKGIVSPGGEVNNTQINVYTGDRNALLKMLRETETVMGSKEFK